MARSEKARHSHLTLATQTGPAPSPASTSAHHAIVSSEPEEREALQFEEEVATLAGIVPVPSHVTRAMRGILERALLMRFEFAEDVDAWMTGSNARLNGASPYERLLDGDGMAVLRALLSVPTNPQCLGADMDDTQHEAGLDGLLPMRWVG
jgi:hypothetical protein